MNIKKKLFVIYFYYFSLTIIIIYHNPLIFKVNKDASVSNEDKDMILILSEDY